MGGTNSKPEEDKALQLCYERMNIVRQALDARSVFAANQSAYVEALKAIGIHLREFVESETPFQNAEENPSSPGVLEPEDEFMNGESSLTNLPPLRRPSPRVISRVKLVSNVKNKVVMKDFFSSVKEIELLFIQAADSGRELSETLEANDFNFDLISPSGEETPQTSVKYLTWHDTSLSPSSSSRSQHNVNSTDAEDSSDHVAGNLCTNLGSHASILDQLYAWEKKLYDEVKGCAMVRRIYDERCKVLRQMEFKEESSGRIDNVRAVVKDLHSSIGVAIDRINSISRKIEDLRDNELQPHLEDLIQRLRRMWEVMLDSHKRQHHIISVSYPLPGNVTASTNSPDSRRESVTRLQNEFRSLSPVFTDWITAQKMYVEAINAWLVKCVFLEETSSRRRRRRNPPPLRKYGPPVYSLCGVWLDAFGSLPAKDVADTVEALTSELTRLLPPPEKRGDPRGNGPSFDRFHASLTVLLGQLSRFADSSVKMFTDIQNLTQDAKCSYAQFKSFV
ncbi:hypothetical protein DM860_009929 [Cuscuta australis]|uniref:DUF632 domain-containing protein n=1 Tax=Cuscuta australis TaxID=267555 RepID=A0A328DBE3_9ASTE|nr:hypothetical protein DM860_009929 [Cuscuta australis]